MPYIAAIDRPYLGHLMGARAVNAGELNFQVSILVTDYLKRKGLSYAAINEVIGVLEAAKLELYRRVAVPYEDRKISENGDIYPPGFWERKS